MPLAELLTLPLVATGIFYIFHRCSTGEKTLPAFGED